jgi:DNA repair protein RecO (recombination protein O)
MLPEQPQRTFAGVGLVLKRSNAGEADRIITLFTRDHGKLVCLAKGIRKITSTKKSHLEPGNLTKIYGITTRGMPLLTQAQLITDHALTKASLESMRRLVQILELTDRLFTENQAEPELFDDVIAIITQLNKTVPNIDAVRHQLYHLIQNLGYHEYDKTKYANLWEYIAEITDRPLNGANFLQVSE